MYLNIKKLPDRRMPGGELSFGCGHSAEMSSDVPGNRQVVATCVKEHLTGKFSTQGFTYQAGAVLREFGENFFVVVWIDHHGDMLVVLSSSTQHGRTADVDVFDRLFPGDVWFGDGLLKRVEVHDDEVKRQHTVCHHGLDMFFLRTIAEDATEDLRMEGFQTSVHHLWKAGVVGDVDDWNFGSSQFRGSSAGGENPEAQAVEPDPQVSQPFLVRH